MIARRGLSLVKAYLGEGLFEKKRTLRKPTGLCLAVAQHLAFHHGDTRRHYSAVDRIEMEGGYVRVLFGFA